MATTDHVTLAPLPSWKTVLSFAVMAMFTIFLVSLALCFYQTQPAMLLPISSDSALTTYTHHNNNYRSARLLPHSSNSEFYPHLPVFACLTVEGDEKYETVAVFPPLFHCMRAPLEHFWAIHRLAPSICLALLLIFWFGFYTFLISKKHF
jgi:hypothetical protein